MFSDFFFIENCNEGIKSLNSLQPSHTVYTRFVQKVSGLTTVHEVDKAYGVLTLSSTKFPSAATHFAQHFCHCWKHFANSYFGMSNSVFVEFHLMSSVASNQCPLRTLLSLGNRKKSHGARCGEYGSCCNSAVPYLAKNCCIRCEVCAGALSWCRIQSPSRHFSGHFRQTDSRKHRKTSM